jgi:hypothetical protein
MELCQRNHCAKKRSGKSNGFNVKTKFFKASPALGLLNVAVSSSSFFLLVEFAFVLLFDILLLV